MIIIFFSWYFIILGIIVGLLVVLAYDTWIFPKRIKRLKELEDFVCKGLEGLE